MLCNTRFLEILIVRSSVLQDLLLSVRVKVLFTVGIVADAPVSNSDILGNRNFYRLNTLDNSHFLPNQSVEIFLVTTLINKN